MSFDTLESSRAQGDPINLYLFKGSDTIGGENLGPYAYTDAEHPITFAGNTYAPISISRDAISTAGTLDNTTLAIRLPQDASIASVFQAWAPSQIVSVFIRQGHANDSEYIVCFTGRVLGFEKTGGEMTFTCEPIATSIRRPGLRRRYQYGCPHALYGPQCMADQPSATNSATVIGTTGDSVHLQTGWNSLAAGVKYTGGLMKWVDGSGITVLRRVLRVTGDWLQLSGPLLGIGSTVQVTLGCNHGMSDCTSLHNNINNFGGQPFIPKKNPFDQVNYFD